jgi:hypothetical protein
MRSSKTARAPRSLRYLVSVSQPHWPVMAIFVIDRSSPSAVMLGLRYVFFILVASFRVISVPNEGTGSPNPRADKPREQSNGQLPSG